MKGTISGNSIVVAAKNQVSCDLSGEAAILNLKSNIYYGLDAVGAWIWNLIQEPKMVKEIQNAILKEFDVEPDRCKTDLLGLLEEFEAQGLIEVKNESSE